ncbi:MAG: DUF4440 domain-containing protein [Acidobacteria bacterium]|nr:MAG: DUF4440 domain-containing protein [Acidobacteriota bacterium]
MKEMNDIKKLFDLWNQSLLTGNPKEVVKHYAPDAVLMPTLSNKVRTTHAAIEDYFVFFLAREPVGHIDESHIQLFGDLAIHSGLYTFTFKDQTSSQARFSFVYKKEGKSWLIVEHHSSLMPEG